MYPIKFKSFTFLCTSMCSLVLCKYPWLSQQLSGDHSLDFTRIYLKHLLWKQYQAQCIPEHIEDYPKYFKNVCHSFMFT